MAWHVFFVRKVRAFSNVCVTQHSPSNKKPGFCLSHHDYMRFGTRVKVETAFSVVNWLWGCDSSAAAGLKDRLESLLPPVGTGIGLRRMQARQGTFSSSGQAKEESPRADRLSRWGWLREGPGTEAIQSCGCSLLAGRADLQG